MDSIPIIQDNEKIDSERHLFQWPSSFNSNLCPSPSCQFMPNCLSSSLYPLTEASPFNLFMQSCDCFNFSQTQSNQTGSSENNAKNLLENDFRTKPKRGRPPSLHKQLNETEGQYRCIFCYFTCKSLHEFLKHIDIHAGPKQPFVCQLCGKGKVLKFIFIQTFRNKNFFIVIFLLLSSNKILSIFWHGVIIFALIFRFGRFIVHSAMLVILLMEN